MENTVTCIEPLQKLKGFPAPRRLPVCIDVSLFKPVFFTLWGTPHQEGRRLLYWVMTSIFFNRTKKIDLNRKTKSSTTQHKGKYYLWKLVSGHTLCICICTRPWWKHRCVFYYASWVPYYAFGFENKTLMLVLATDCYFQPNISHPIQPPSSMPTNFIGSHQP